MKRLQLDLTVNGDAHVLFVAPNATLLEVLRDDLELTGAKEGCGEGVCGSCTVLVEDRPVRACLTLALEADGCRILTVEGLARGQDLDPLQQAFIDHGAVQCGFCTSGMLMSAKGLIMGETPVDQKAVRTALSGHVCRCTGYTKILEAVEAAAETTTKER